MPRNDPEYQKRYIRQHYQANKEYYKAKAKARDALLRPKLHAFVNRYKVWKGCADCGYNANPLALQLDHIRDKHKAVSALVQECASIQRIKQEIRKCEVRCANCHMIVTYERRQDAKEIRRP